MNHFKKAWTRYGAVCCMLLIAALFLLSCKTADCPCQSNPVASGEGEESMIALKADDSGGTFEVKKGRTFSVSLEAIGTAGYQWQAESLDADLLELVNKEFKVHDPDKVGSAGTDTWTLRAKAAGETTLSLKLCRPWDCENTVAERFEVHLKLVE